MARKKKDDDRKKLLLLLLLLFLGGAIFFFLSGNGDEASASLSLKFYDRFGNLIPTSSLSIVNTVPGVDSIEIDTTITNTGAIVDFTECWIEDIGTNAPGAVTDTFLDAVWHFSGKGNVDSADGLYKVVPLTVGGSHTWASLKIFVEPLETETQPLLVDFHVVCDTEIGTAQLSLDIKPDPVGTFSVTVDYRGF